MEGNKEQAFPSHTVLLLGLLSILQQLSHLPTQLPCMLLCEPVCGCIQLVIQLQGVLVNIHHS